MKHIDYKSRNCCGCGSCFVSCPLKAISFKKDGLGFPYPVVDQTVCVDCGLCLKVCPFNHVNHTRNPKPKDVYAVMLKDARPLSKSASGGAFYGLANHAIKNGYIVYGAAWTEDFDIEHIRVDDVENLFLLQGSKYSQSDVTSCFNLIKKDLDDGLKVLFSGTPCQAAAIKLFLQNAKANMQNLLIVDIICHGVGSPSILKDELSFFEKKYKHKLTNVLFRSKEKGWGATGQLVFGDKKVLYGVTNSPYYYYYYLRNSIFRASCYNCSYASSKRPGDITIGDFWGIESVREFRPSEIRNGVSCMMINTEKGRSYFMEISDDFKAIPALLKTVEAKNRQLVECCTDDERKRFVRSLYEKYGYSAFAKHYRRKEFVSVIREKIKSFVPYKIKSLFKRHQNM